LPTSAKYLQDSPWPQGHNLHNSSQLHPITLHGCDPQQFVTIARCIVLQCLLHPHFS
jgi:hypothetical protein